MFRTPFGRYCWKRLPFELSVSQDLFQAKTDQILKGLEGVASIANDIVIYGKDENEQKPDRPDGTGCRSRYGV